MVFVINGFHRVVCVLESSVQIHPAAREQNVRQLISMTDSLEDNMKRILLIFFILIFTYCEQNSKIQLKVIELEGTPYNRGLVHGQSLKEEIKQVISQWTKASEMMHDMKFDDIKNDFLEKTNYLDAIKKWTPELLDEIKGISDGSGIDYETIFLFQISEELESYGRNLFMQKCTSIGVNKTDINPTYVAQNMDPPTFLHGFPTLLHIKDNRSNLESYVFTFPGFIGLNGLNNESIAITANGLPNLYDQIEGLPVSFIIRGVLDKTSFKDAVEFIHDIKHAKAQNYIIGGQDESRCFECSTREINQFIPFENADITYHTNHYLVDACESKYCSRLKTLEDEIKRRSYKIGFQDIKQILSSRKRNAGRPISNVWTYGCTIMVLSESPELYITPGRPDKTLPSRRQSRSHRC